MKALVILAHGSRRMESNEEVRLLATQVKRQDNDEYDFVEHAFLEIAEPDLLTAYQSLIERGITEIITLPYFLNSGNHVTQDIPALLDSAKQKYPECTFHLSQAVGSYKGMPKLILDSAKLT